VEHGSAPCDVSRGALTWVLSGLLQHGLPYLELVDRLHQALDPLLQLLELLLHQLRPHVLLPAHQELRRQLQLQECLLMHLVKVLGFPQLGFDRLGDRLVSCTGHGSLSSTPLPPLAPQSTPGTKITPGERGTPLLS
jgi:hypothetical protein